MLNESIKMVQIKFMAQQYVNWSFLGVLQHENKDTRKTIRLKIFPSLLFFINLLVNICFTQHIMSFIDDATLLRKFRLHQILGQF